MRSKGFLTPANPFICPRCRFRAQRNYSSLSNPFSRHSSAQGDGLRFSRLAGRSLIKLAGPDTTDFLHNLLPAQIIGRPADIATAPIYTVFLNAQGRILNDVFVYPPSRTGEEDTWYIEVDSEGRSALLQHLKKHKLRSKFKLGVLDEKESSVWYTWPEVSGVEGRDIQGAVSRSIGGQDPRPGMGGRFLATSDAEQEALQRLLGDAGELAPPQDYTIHRMLNGTAEGSREIIPSSALPMETNVEFCGGIDFHKGCYLGQELTIRTHHTGVIRKRILPVQLYDESHLRSAEQLEPVYDSDATALLPAATSNIAKSSSSGRGRSVGKWLGGVGNIGLALCRLEIMTGLQLTEEGSHYNPKEEFTISWEPLPGEPKQTVKVKAFVPLWLSQGILGEMERRQRRTTRAEEEDDDEE